jgi:hypothetical protein
VPINDVDPDICIWKGREGKSLMQLKSMELSIWN